MVQIFPFLTKIMFENLQTSNPEQTCDITGCIVAIW